MKSKLLFPAVALVGVLAAGSYLAFQSTVPTETRSALILPAPVNLPQFSLLDQKGELVSAATFRGQWDLVFFGFTHCPDICPTTLQILNLVKTKIEDEGADVIPRIVLVSVDPARDTPEQLDAYLNHFGEGNLGVTGDIDELRTLTSKLGIFFEKQHSDDDNYTVNHSAAVIVLNPYGQFHALFSAPHVVADYVHDLQIITSIKIDVLPPLVASNVEVTVPLPGSNMSAGYLTLANNSSASISISRIKSGQFESIEIHESILRDGVSEMHLLPELIIAAGAVVTLERGGKHLMMTGPVSEATNVSLDFYAGDALLLSVDSGIGQPTDR